MTVYCLCADFLCQSVQLLGSLLHRLTELYSAWGHTGRLLTEGPLYKGGLCIYYNPGRLLLLLLLLSLLLLNIIIGVLYHFFGAQFGTNKLNLGQNGASITKV
jgi:hypothetical protein